MADEIVSDYRKLEDVYVDLYINNTVRQIQLSILIENHRKWLSKFDSCLNSIVNVPLPLKNFLFRKKRKRIEEEFLNKVDQSLRLNLSLTLDNKGVDLSNLDLSNLDLRYAILRNVDFSKSKMTNTNLSQCDLTRANFTDTDIADCSFQYSKLFDVILDNAVINVNTLKKTKSLQEGGIVAVNGILAQSTNPSRKEHSFTFLSVKSEPTSERNEHVDSAIKNLDQAKKTFNTYLLLTISTLIALLSSYKIIDPNHIFKFIGLTNVLVTDEYKPFILIGVVGLVCLFITIKVYTYAQEAYLIFQNSEKVDTLVAISSFPWTLTINIQHQNPMNFIKYLVSADSYSLYYLIFEKRRIRPFPNFYYAPFNSFTYIYVILLIWLSFLVFFKAFTFLSTVIQHIKDFHFPPTYLDINILINLALLFGSTMLLSSLLRSIYYYIMNYFNVITSYITRIILIFASPLFLFLLLFKFYNFNLELSHEFRLLDFILNESHLELSIYCIIVSLLVVFCLKLFQLTEQFQYPFIYDPLKEKKDKDRKKNAEEALIQIADHLSTIAEKKGKKDDK